MNTEDFKVVFYGLTPRRREVLDQLLSGKTDVAIAQSLCIATSTVRKHIEEICNTFGLKNLPGERFSQRERLISLIATHKPDLVKAQIINIDSNSNLTEQTSQTSTSIPQDLPQTSSPVSTNKIPKKFQHNLPSRHYSAFIGQQEYITRLLELLSFSCPTPAVSIEGIGGVGKTSLVLEAAYRCLEASHNSQDSQTEPTFDAIIFTSAKTQQLIGTNISRRLQRERTLEDIFRVIFRTLDCLDRIPPDFDTQLESVKKYLANQRILLIIDNLETLEEKEDVLSFVGELPPTVKVVLTTRIRTGLGVTIYLDCLPPQEGKNLIQSQAQEKGVQLNPEQLQTLYHKTGGLPLAAVYVIGQVSVYGFPPQAVSIQLNEATKDIAHFCFSDSVQLLKGQPPHQLLMALALFPHSATPEAIAAVASPETNPNFINGLDKLYKLCLVVQQGGRYSMLSLTREYAFTELLANPEFEREARQRWINWYLRFSEPDTERDWKQWNEYGNIEQEWENLRAVIEYCISQELYETFKKFWQHLKGYTYVYGYWNERLTWIDWLLAAARQRKDRSTEAEALCDKGWTLTLMNQPEQLASAEALFEESWNLKDDENIIFQLELAINRAVLSIQQQNFEAARYWLNVEQELLEKVPIDDQKRLCQLIRILYYDAQILFRTGNYEQAKTLYQEALHQAHLAGWQQMEVYIMNWLADIAIEQDNPDEAERFLNISLPIAEENKDKRSIALQKRSRAKLEKLRGNIVEYQRWVAEASESFARLGMS